MVLQPKAERTVGFTLLAEIAGEAGLGETEVGTLALGEGCCVSPLGDVDRVGLQRSCFGIVGYPVDACWLPVNQNGEHWHGGNVEPASAYRPPFCAKIPPVRGMSSGADERFRMRYHPFV